MKLGRRIVELRKENNMTQFELAFVVNIAERSLSAIETGKVFPNSLILFRIADAFGISVSELINF